MEYLEYFLMRLTNKAQLILSAYLLLSELSLSFLRDILLTIAAREEVMQLGEKNLRFIVITNATYFYISFLYSSN